MKHFANFDDFSNLADNASNLNEAKAYVDDKKLLSRRQRARLLSQSSIVEFMLNLWTSL